MENSEKSIEELLRLAQEGDAEANFRLAVMYRDGAGVQQSYETAFGYFSDAAEHGQVEALNELGVMYNTGRGVKSDKSKAFEYFTRAAKRGDRKGQYNLAVAYLGGHGVSQSISQALFWFSRAADSGDPDARYALGYMYEYGQGVEQSDERAARCYESAAEVGQTDAQLSLAFMYREGRGVERSDEKAAEYFARAADKNVRARTILGNMYLNGEGIARSPENAFKYFKMAADVGDKTGEYELGKCYRDGIGTPAEPREAIKYLERAAAHDFVDAQLAVGDFYRKTRGYENRQKALNAYRDAQSNGSDIAAFFIGVMYHTGNGCAAERRAGLEMINEAAAIGVEAAEEYLARMRARGIPTASDSISVDTSDPSYFADLQAMNRESEQYYRDFCARYTSQSSDVDEVLELAFDYLKGRKEKPKSPKKAELNFRRAGALGAKEAPYYVALCREQQMQSRGNKGPGYDDRTVGDLYLIAAEAGVEKAYAKVGKYFIHRDRSVAERYLALAAENDADACSMYYTYFSGENNAKAMKFMEKMAYAGNAEAQYIFGSHSGSRAMLEKAADQGYEKALLPLGIMLVDECAAEHHSSPEKLEHAYVYLKQAYDAGAHGAAKELARCLEMSDLPEASDCAMYYAQAVEEGDGETVFYVATKFMKGTPKMSADYVKAFELLKRIEAGKPAGFRRFGALYGYMAFMYQNGYGVSRDLNKAKEYYDKARGFSDFATLMYPMAGETLPDLERYKCRKCGKYTFTGETKSVFGKKRTCTACGYTEKVK